MIEKRPFGRTGHDSTVIVFGGAAFMNGATQAQADATLEALSSLVRRARVGC